MNGPRIRRLKADYEKVIEEFTGHNYVSVITEEARPPEIYYVTYRVAGLRLENKTPVENHMHKVVFYLGKDYPKLKPKCEIKTPIFHPNFRGGIVCIGDQWTAGGETLIDLIIKVGDMIQYKDYKLKSPLDAKAAKWAKENESFFPVGNLDLYRSELELQIGLAENDDWTIEIVNKEETIKADDIVEFEIDIHEGKGEY